MSEEPWNGKPPIPEVDGIHWILGWDNKPFAAEWDPWMQEWSWPGGVGSYIKVAKLGWSYLGPALTPAELKASHRMLVEEILYRASDALYDRAEIWRNKDDVDEAIRNILSAEAESCGHIVSDLPKGPLLGEKSDE